MEKQEEFLSFLFWPVIMVINLSFCLLGLSSVIASQSSLPSRIHSVSYSKSSLLQSRFSIQSLTPILPCLFCSALFVFSHSFTPPFYRPSTPPLLSVSHTDCFVRHLCSRRVLPQSCADLLKYYKYGHTQGDGWSVVVSKFWHTWLNQEVFYSLLLTSLSQQF